MVGSCPVVLVCLGPFLVPSLNTGAFLVPSLSTGAFLVFLLSIKVYILLAQLFFQVMVLFGEAVRV